MKSFSTNFVFLFAGNANKFCTVGANEWTLWRDRYIVCRLGHESLCRNLWRRCLSLDQQRHKLDCGQYWLDQNSYLRTCRLAAGGTGGTNLFAGTYSSGVFLSTNNGTSWTAVNSGLTEHLCLAPLPSRHESLCRN